jgi:anti-anti-sigma factor
MERHLTTSTGSKSTRNDRSTPGIGVIRAETPFNRNTVLERNGRTAPARNQSHPLAESVSVRTHTLILTGELTHGSAHTLEVEMERLFEEGVTAITLDLRQLTHIDSIGVGVIVFRCRLCRRQGHGVALIPGPQLIQRAFAEAGVIDRLPFQEDELAARRLRAAATLTRHARESCEG